MYDVDNHDYQIVIALSLGLVGALSIVRFWAAIKEPEELADLFFCVAVGLGFGADLCVITLMSSFLIIVIIVVKGLFFKKAKEDMYNLSVSSDVLSLQLITSMLIPFSNNLKLRQA